MDRHWKLTAQDAIDAEDDARLRKRIQELPTITRQVVTLRKAYGLSQHEIASRLGIDLEQVETHLVAAVTACADFGEIADA